jgi:hypothetical protein
MGLFEWSVLAGVVTSLVGWPSLRRQERRRCARAGLARLALERGKFVS